MPQFIPTVSVGVSRKEGTRNRTIFPKIGEMFDFTDEEIKQIRASNPEGLRDPINETGQRAPRPAPSPEEVTSEKQEASEDHEETVTRQVGRKAPASRRGASSTEEDDF
jgi:hypothetical protein